MSAIKKVFVSSVFIIGCILNSEAQDFTGFASINLDFMMTETLAVPQQTVVLFKMVIFLI